MGESLSNLEKGRKKLIEMMDNSSSLCTKELLKQSQEVDKLILDHIKRSLKEKSKQ